MKQIETKTGEANQSGQHDRTASTRRRSEKVTMPDERSAWLRELFRASGIDPTAILGDQLA